LRVSSCVVVLCRSSRSFDVRRKYLLLRLTQFTVTSTLLAIQVAEKPRCTRLFIKCPFSKSDFQLHFTFVCSKTKSGSTRSTPTSISNFTNKVGVIFVFPRFCPKGKKKKILNKQTKMKTGRRRELEIHNTVYRGTL
jgi:hypothetical protein